MYNTQFDTYILNVFTLLIVPNLYGILEGFC